MDGIKRYKTDIIIVAIILILTAVSFPVLRGGNAKGSRIVILKDDKEINSIDIPVNSRQVINIDGNDNVLVIDGDCAYMESASCPDKICVNRGIIKYDGEMIVCLPHKVIVKVVSDREGDVDARVGQ